MNSLFRLLLTLNATLWMGAVYALKTGKYIFTALLIIVPIILSFATIGIAGLLAREKIDECSDFDLADSEFLQIYITYFFVSLSINDTVTMVVIYILVFVFTLLSDAKYFNPIYLMLGYHYYNAKTIYGTRYFVIVKGPVRRNDCDMALENLRRINDSTFIEREPWRFRKRQPEDQ